MLKISSKHLNIMNDFAKRLDNFYFKVIFAVKYRYIHISIKSIFEIKEPRF